MIKGIDKEYYKGYQGTQNIGALLLRIGVWRPLYCDCSKAEHDKNESGEKQAGRRGSPHYATPFGFRAHGSHQHLSSKKSLGCLQNPKPQNMNPKP